LAAQVLMQIPYCGLIRMNKQVKAIVAHLLGNLLGASLKPKKEN
jgi:hypothetical protein